MTHKYYAIKIVGGQESSIAQLLMNRAKMSGLPIYSIIQSPAMKGYLIIEADNQAVVSKLINEVKNVKSIVPGVLTLNDIMPLIKVKSEELTLQPEQVVEVINGPFKGMKAKVIRYNKEKKEATIMLLESAVPIQINVDASYLKPAS
ncbi:MAG: transcription elongation factor Spt5 [Nitrososphaeria archaeon]